MTTPQVKRMMEAFIATTGMTDKQETCDGTSYHFVAPNRFGPGYIEVITDGIFYEASLMRKDPRRVSTIHSRPYVSPIQERINELASLRQRLAEGASLDDFDRAFLHHNIEQTKTWLRNHGEEVE